MHPPAGLQVVERDVLVIIGALTIENQMLKEKALALLRENEWLGETCVLLLDAADGKETLDEEALAQIHARLDGNP